MTSGVQGKEMPRGLSHRRRLWGMCRITALFVTGVSLSKHVVAIKILRVSRTVIMDL
jgi:hypothetical protein